MKNKIIGFDFDGVIVNPIPAKIYLAKKLGFSILPKQTHSCILQKIIGKSGYQKIAYKLYREATLKFKACKGVKKLIRRLKKNGHSLIIISARGIEERLFAQEWLEKRNLMSFFDKAIFCLKSKKPAIIKKYKPDFYIDDDPRILNLCPKNIKKFLYNSYNINKKQENFTIIKDFKDF